MGNKKKATGQAERLAVLGRYLPQAEAIYREIRAQWPKRDLASDDILDALVGAVTASRPEWLASLPDAVEVDELGLPMEIVYAVPNGWAMGEYPFLPVAPSASVCQAQKRRHLTVSA